MTDLRKLRVPIPIRFADIDALGHVNNAVFLSYIEVARIAFRAERIGPVRVDQIDFVLARVEIDFRRPVVLTDTLHCDVWVETFGRTSFTFAYTLAVGETVVAEARSVQVFVDLATGRPKPVPEEFRRAMSG